MTFEFETATWVGERYSNSAVRVIAESPSNAIAYATGYRMDQVNSRRRKRPEGDGIDEFWQSGAVNSHGQNSTVSTGYSGGPVGRESGRDGQRWRSDRY